MDEVGVERPRPILINMELMSNIARAIECSFGVEHCDEVVESKEEKEKCVE